MLTGASVAILVTSFGLLLQALYLSGDMDFLMSTPIPIRAVFLAKLVQAVLPNLGLVAAFSLPILFGLGIAGGYSLLYYPFVLIVLVLLALAAAALGSLLVMVVARFFPARRVAEVLGFVVGTFFFIISQTTRFYEFDVDQQQLAGLLNLTARVSQPWSPLAWAGRGLYNLGTHNWLPAIGYLAATLAFAAGVFYLSLLVSEQLYATGWSSLQNNRRRARVQVQPGARTQKVNPLARLLPAPVRAILVKDLLVYRRDLRHLSQLVTPLILGVVYAISLLRSGGQGLEGHGNAPDWFMEAVNGVMLYGDVALALFLGWMLVSNLAGLGFSQEGKFFWMLKAAPVSSRQLLLAKFLVAYLPSWLICTVYLLILEILKGSSLWTAVVSLIAVAVMLAGLNSINLAFGVRGAKFDWETLSQRNQAVGCLGSVVGMLVLLLCFMLYILPPLLMTGFLRTPPIVGQLVGLALGSIAGLTAAIVPMRLVESYVARLNEG
jgi:ABC-2 type transport system permease protein